MINFFSPDIDFVYSKFDNDRQYLWMEIMAGGRPTLYTPELVEEICVEIISSIKSIDTLCAEKPHWPHQSNIYRWIHRYPEFRDKYMLAKELQSLSSVDKIREILNDPSFDFYVDEDGKKHINYAHLQRLRMDVDTIKWQASKLAPKFYGDTVKDNSESNDKSLIEKLIDKL